MRKLVTLVLGLLVIIGIVFLVIKDRNKSVIIDDNETQILNPMQEYDSIEEASKITGFGLSLPDEYKTLVSGVYTINNEILDVRLKNGDIEILNIRKAKGDKEDISGVYEEYYINEEVDIDGINVKLKMEDGKVMVANWKNSQNTYSIYAQGGIEKEDVLNIISRIK